MTSDSADAPVWSIVAPMFVHFAVLSLMAIGGGVVMVAPATFSRERLQLTTALPSTSTVQHPH